MEKKNILSDDMLWDYADGLLDEKERAEVDFLLQQQPESRLQLEAILAEKRAFLAFPLEKTDTGFADRVMGAWVAQQAAAPAPGKDWVIFSIVGAFGAFLLAAFGLFLALTPAEIGDLEPIGELAPKMPAVDWALLFDSPVLQYGLMLTLCLLGLQILDKFLQQKNQWSTAI